MLPSFFRSFKKEYSDVFYLFLLQGVNYLIPLAIMPYLMIKLGADKYGYIGFSQAVIQYFLLFVDFGFNLSATKKIAIAKNNKDELSRVFFSTLYAKVFLLLFSSCIFLVLAFGIERFYIYKTTLLATFPMLIGNTFTFTWMYQGIGRIRIVSLITTFSKILVLPLIFVFVQTENDYIKAALIQSSVYVLAGLISTYYLLKLRIVSFFSFLFLDIKRQIKDSFPLFLSSAAISMYTQLFVIVLGVFSTPDIVGRYSAAERLMRALCLMSYVPISQTFFPKIAAMSLVNKSGGKRLFYKLLLLLSGIMLSISIGLFIFSDFISGFLGSAYQGISVLLKIFSFAPFAIGLGAMLGQIGLIALGDDKTRLKFQKVYFTVACISLVLISILTPFLMEIGTALALVFTEYSVLILMFYYNKKYGIC
ncbi:oligosaccharide flippase family protein [Bacteroides nordii]|uniref:oligosaccharide flippase family protein n=1 Tax=Bacteroides nordii TaxID=291645 RepID=UPI0021097E47|nr:oligosaccharide flippase family protein [Bacteroides nordii]MCQ4914170.1 oligosaccharide flippase family protein [Bacteroides nordii]